MSAVSSGFTFLGSVVPAVLVGGLTAVVVVEVILAKLGPAPGEPGLQPTASVDLGLPPPKAFDRAVRAVESLPGAEVRKCDRAAGVIVATIGRTRVKLGDSLRLELRRRADQTEVVVASRSRQPFAIVDRGRNDRHVRAVVARLEAADPE